MQMHEPNTTRLGAAAATIFPSEIILKVLYCKTLNGRKS